MWLFVLTLGVMLIAGSALVGFAAAGLRQKYDRFLTDKVLIATVVFLFVVSDLYYLPLVDLLDVTVTIRNPEFASILGPGTPIDLIELLRPSGWDVPWIILNGILSYGFYRFALRHP